MAYIEVVSYDDASGRLREIYDLIIAKRRKLASVHMIQSLNPETILTHIELYMSIMFAQSPLTRAQREMIAVVVSAANGCEYCQEHHGEALNSYWKNEWKVNQLRKDFNEVSLTPEDKQLCELARRLTLDPQHSQDARMIAESKRLGLDDRKILDATLVIAYFNFVNRIVMGLGVELEHDGGKNYDY